MTSFKKKNLFLAVLGLHCYVWAFSSCGELGLVSVVGYGLILVAASLAVEHRLKGTQASVVVVHGLDCPMACGIFPDQGSNLCPLHWQADS